MSLLYDQLLADPHIGDGIKKALSECIVVEATNVSNYYFQENDQSIWGKRVEDFPNIAPPFERFFLEFQAPSHYYSHDHQELAWDYRDMPSKWGLCCGGGEIDDETRATWYEVLRRREELSDVEGVSDGTFDFLSQIQDKARWDMSFVLYFKFNIPRIQHIHGPFCRWDAFVGEDGRPIAGSKGLAMVNTVPMAYIDRRTNQLTPFDVEQVKKKELIYDTIDNFGNTLDTAFLAISFMHCKNVALKQVKPALPKPLTNSQRRRGEHPRQFVTYHVLDIEPMKQVLKTEGQSEKVGMQRSLHICRGHFAHYGEDKKLFGKYAGTFWKPQHARGSMDVGIATKDYHIKKIKGMPA